MHFSETCQLGRIVSSYMQLHFFDRCKGVIGFVFRVLCPNSFLIRFSHTQQNGELVLSKSMMKHHQRSDKNSSLCFICLGYCYQKCMCCWFLEWIYRSFQLCSLLSAGLLIKTRRLSSNLFETCVVMLFVLWSSPNHTLIKYRCPMKKSNRVTPAHFDTWVVFWMNLVNTYNFSTLVFVVVFFLLSDFSSTFQSSMTIFHYRNGRI